MWLTKSSIQQSTQQVAGPPTCSLGLAALSASAACVYLLREINIYRCHFYVSETDPPTTPVRLQGQILLKGSDGM